MAILMKVTLTQEALSLFAPLRPCPECKRPLPESPDDDYQRWEGCSVGERERSVPEASREE